MNITPLRDKIIVKPIKRVESALYIQTAEADSVGYVTAIGPDAAKEGVKVGDKIHFGTYDHSYKNEYLKFEELKLNDERHLKMSWQDICFIYED